MSDEISVFMIHRWDMEEIRKMVINLLESAPDIKLIDKSYSKNNPAEASDDLIPDYSAGQIMNSDIVLVLLPTDKNIDLESEIYHKTFKYHEDIPLAPDSFSLELYASIFGLKPDFLYLIELVAIMYDVANDIPVLVLGWDEESARILANILRHPFQLKNFKYDSQRIYSLGVKEKMNPRRLAKMIVRIANKYKK